jgi:hypothetical protein
MANKKISQLFENPYPRTGDIFPIVQDGVTYKVTLDNLNRFQNDTYFITHNLDPYILDDLSNRYGRYRFISGNLMISGKGTDAHLPHLGSCVLRLYDGNFILNGSGIISGLNSGVTDLGHTNDTKGLYAVTIGQFNVNNGPRNEIFGSRNSASGNNITIVGEDNYSTGSLNHVHGHNNILNSNDVKIFGNYNTGFLFSTGSFIVGKHNYVGNTTEAGANSLVYGDYNKVSGKSSLVYGRNNLVKIKSGALEKISVYGLENNVSGIEVDIYGRLNLNSGLTNQIYGHSNTGYGDINFVAGTYNKIQKPSVENHIYGDYNILTRGSGNFVVGRRNEASANTSDLIGECIFVSGTGNWVGGKDSNVTGIDIISLGKDINITHYGNFSNVVGRGNTINGSGYYSDVYGSDNLNSGFKAIIVGKNNTNSLKSTETTIVGRINESYNEKQVIVGERNISTAPRSYTVGQNNDNYGTSGYIFGEENIIYSNNFNSYIIGRSNTNYSDSDNPQSKDVYIFGLSNINGTSNINNYLIGNANSISDFSINNISVGYSNDISSEGDNSNVFGRNNILYGNIFSTVVGKSNSIYNGTGNYIFGQENVMGNFGTAYRASVFGSGNTIDANDSATYGYNNTVTTTSTRSHVFGLGNTSSGANTVLVGSGNKNSGVNSMVVGYGNTNTLSGSNSNIFGRGNTSHANNLSVYGSGNHVTGADSATYGYGNRISINSTRTLTFGLENASFSRNQTNVGSGNLNSGIDSWVIGYGNNLQTGNFNYAVGNNNIISSGLTGVMVLGDNITIPLSGNAGYKLNPNNMNNVMQIGVNNSGKITILSNGNIAIGTSGTLPFENPQELLHVRSGNVLLDATEGGYFKFYDKNQYDNIPDNPSQVAQPGDIRAIVSGGNFKIDGDLVLSTGYGETGQFLKGRIFQEAFTRNLDGSMWCYTPSDFQGNCTNANVNPYNNNVETIVGTDRVNYVHKVGLWQPTGLDLGWDTIGSPTINYASGYGNGYISNTSVKDGAIAKPDFCNGDCNFDYQPHEVGRISGLATIFLDGNPTSAIITGRYTLVNTPIMKTTNLYLPPVNQNSGVLYTVKNLGKGNIMVFATGSEKIDLFFTGFMIDQRFASHEFLSNGSGWFLV